MYNKKVLIESLKKLGNAKAPTQKKDIIMNSVRGQWDNPGDITQVPGSKITMGPDPLTGKPLTQPLLGVGSNGQRQMMYPGKDYDFGDAEYVTEYPQMGSGGNKQNHVVVKKSNIQGNGLFINEPIRKGDIIGLAHINNQPTPIVGKNHNHSENNPTAVTISQGNKRYLVAAKDLPAGTEITTNYRLQPELEQPEDFMRNGGMTPTFKKGGGPGDKWLASLVKQGTRSNNLLTYPVKLAGERIARLNAFPSRSKQDIIDSLFKKDYEATYFGNGTNAGKEKYGFGKRDLIANYFRGIDTGFEPTNYDFDSDAGLEALINEYGPLKAYLMNSQVQHEEPLHARDLLYHRFDKSMPHSEYDYPNMLIRDPNISDNWNYSFHNYDADKTKENFHKLFDLYGKEIIPFDIQPNTSKKPPLFSFDYSPVNPIDNVGGHMGFLQRTPENKFQLTTRDSWGFFPPNYDPKWNMSDKFKQRQTQLMHVFGKPFILTQNNPITFKKGGIHKTKNKNSRSYSRSFDATNKFFAENYLFEKPSSRKNKIYDPHAKYYQKGGASSPEAWGQEIKDLESQIGNPDSWTLEDYYLLQDKLNDYRNWRETTPEGQAVNDSHNEEGEYNIPLPEHLRNYTNAVMKSKLAYANEFGNPAAKRMINLPDNPYQFDNGDTGTHYMASMDNYAVPQIQDENGQLNLGDYGPSSTEAMRFDNPNDARYFAEHYKDVAPGFINAKLSPEEIQEYAKGGYIIEDISVPELDKAQKGKTVKPYYTSDRKDYDYHVKMKADSSAAYNQSIQDLKGFTDIKYIKAGKYTDKTPQAGWSQSYINSKKDDIGNTVKGKIKPTGIYYSTRKSDNEDVVSFAYKKPVQEVIFRANNNTIKKTLTPVPTKVKNVVPEDKVIPQDEITPLDPMSFPEVTRPEQQIIPAAPYVKPVHYAGPRHGTWSDGSKGQFPEGLNTSDWERKTKEYQQQQGGTQPVVIRRQGGELDKAQEGREQTVKDTDKDYYTRMANSPLFVERYARMVGKPIDQVGEEAEAYRQQILNNIETVKINDVGVYPDKVTKRKQSKSIEGVYYPPVEIEKEEIDEIQKNINEAPEFRRKHLQKNFDETVAKLTAPNHNLFLYADDPWARTHELSHASVKGNINDKNVNAYSFDRDLSEYPTLDKYYNSDKKYLKYFDGRKEYLTSPDEQKARVDVARKYLESKGLYDPVNENFTPQHYRNYLMELEKSNNDVPHDIDEITTPYDVETTIKMFNDFVEKEPTQNSNLVKAEQGGSTDYELGDEIDEATMERLKKLGYTFEII